MTQTDERSITNTKFSSGIEPAVRDDWRLDCNSMRRGWLNSSRSNEYTTFT